MSMFYTNQTSKRKPRKPTAAQRQLQAEWESILKSYEPKKVAKAPKKELKDVYTLSTPAGRETKHYPSRDTGGVAVKKETMMYTGTKMIGIGTLHKSNAVPVFCDDEAKAMANMRR
jgi:hypothetical protein